MFVVQLSYPVALLAALTGTAWAKDIYVSPTGTGSGTLAAPYKSIQSAVNAAVAGDVIHLRAGTYAPTTNIQIAKSGTASAPITLRSYLKEKVIIDGEAHVQYTCCFGCVPRKCRQRNSSYPECQLLEVLQLGADQRTIRHLCPGCLLDSYRNRDPRKNGESADGFACKSGSGVGNTLRNARLWDNVDDGLDLFMFTSPVTIEEVYAWGNGVNRWGFSNFNGDGNGFKLGIKDNPATNHVVRNCMAFSNAKKGFIDNGNPGKLTLERNTAWNNGDQGFVFKSSSSTLKANIAVANVGSAQVSIVSTTTATGNSWNSGTWSNSNFKSIDPATLKGARGSDGRVVASTFLVPTSGAAIGATTQADV